MVVHLGRLRPTLIESAAGWSPLLLAADSTYVMTAIAPVGSKVSHVAPAVEPVPVERAMVLPSSPSVVSEVTAIGAQACAIAVTPVVTDRSTIVHETSAIAPQSAPVVADVARVRTNVSAIRADVAGVVSHVASRRRNGRLRRHGDGGECNTERHCGAQGRES